MNRKQKILKLRKELNKLKEERLPLPSFVSAQMQKERAMHDESMSPLADAVKRIGDDVYKIQTAPHIKNLFKLLKKAENSTAERFDFVSRDFSEKMEVLSNELSLSDKQGKTNKAYLRDLERRISAYVQEFRNGIIEADTSFSLLSAENERLVREIQQIEEGANKTLLETGMEIHSTNELAKEALEVAVQATTQINKVPASLLKLESELMSRIAKIGGGNMNRNIAIGGNTSVLSMFNDINLKPGAGTTITYANNITTGFTDITITATGSGSGITREINDVAVNTNAGATPGIDYVYLVSGTTQITLPTAVGNSNLYTIKNVGNGIVTVNTTGGETIDDDSTVIMPVKYTSVDIISNDTNWKIT